MLEKLLDQTSCVITGLADGTVEAANPNPAVGTDVLLDIIDWQSEGATVDDICARLRHRTIPLGYDFHTRIPGIYQGRGVIKKNMAH